MASPAPKRRKTSPTASAPVSASKSNKQQLPTQDAAPSSSKRPSYMSPTKSSISRFNPNVLAKQDAMQTRTRSTRSVARGGSPDKADAPAEDDQEDDETKPSLPFTLRPRSHVNGGIAIDAADLSPDVSDTPSKLPKPRPNGQAKATRSGRRLEHDDRSDAEPSLPPTPSNLRARSKPDRSRGLLFQDAVSKSAQGEEQSKPMAGQLGIEEPLKTSKTYDEQLASLLGSQLFIEAAPQPPPVLENPESYRIRTSLQDLSQRLETLQQELTQDLMAHSWHKDNSRFTKRLTKQKREAGKCYRSILRFKEDLGDGDSMDGTFAAKAKQETPDDTASLGDRLARYLPFSRSAAERTTALSKIPSAFRPDLSRTPFAISISNSTLSTSTSTEILQDVSLSFESSPLASLNLYVNPASQTMTSIRVKQLVKWAAPELLAWLTKPPPVADNSNNRALSNLGRAIGRFLEVARLRGECWARCNASFNTQHLAITCQTTETAPSTALPSPPERMGRQILTLARARSSKTYPAAALAYKLIFQWLIQLQEDGEVRSSITMKNTFPETWRKFDQEGDMDRLDEAFRDVLREKGAAEGVIMLGKILFPQD